MSKTRLPRPPKLRKNKRRTRSKGPYHCVNTERDQNGNINWNFEFDVSLETMTDWTVKPGSLSVIKDDIRNLTYTWWSGRRPQVGQLNSVSFTGVGYWMDPAVTMYTWTPYVNSFKHKKLPTSSSLDVLVSLAEFDDTVAMLARPKRPTYGSVKWGWLPLVNDIMAISDAGANVKKSVLDGNKRVSQYNATHKIQKNSVDVRFGDWLVHHRWEVEVKHIGTVSYENDILAFYDYLGFHPSPKVLWDIVPFSFALDYILPIGDILKKLSPQKGWVKAVNFTGWQIITAKVTEITKYDTYVSNVSDNLGSRTYVTRNYLSGVMLESMSIPRSVPVLKAPNLEQIFDIAYLAEAFYGFSKKAIAPHVYRKRR